MKKTILLGLSFALIVLGIVLLLPSLLYFLHKNVGKQLIGDISALWNIVRAFIGLLADVLGALGIFTLLKKQPPALVAIPPSIKGKLDNPIIGRDGDLLWLQSVATDSLLVGQPGSGKTFLLYKFAKDNLGLFIDRNDIHAITSEYKKKKPKFIIVDDAQLYIELLGRLVQFRERKKADFIILLSCWPGYRAKIADKLNLPEKDIRNLSELTRDEIVQVIEDEGLGGPNELIREIVDQSAGRPGLAITLADICMKGGIRDVILGDVLTRNTSTYLSNILGDQASIVLAAFAVGGNAGLPLDAVAEGLKISLAEVQNIVTYLSNGLVLQTRSGLAIYPPVLRYALVRDKFFGPTPLPIQPFIDRAASLHDVGETLVGAKIRGAKVPWNFLIGILETTNSGDLWSGVAYSGKQEAEWVLLNHPEHLLNLAQAALYRRPDVALTMLLRQADSDKRPLHSTPEHPLRLIKDWVSAAYPGRGDALQRREYVLNAAISWLKSKATPEIGYQALKISLSPEFDRLSSDPGSGDRITIQYGSLTLEEILSLEGVWDRASSLISQFPPDDWLSIREIVEMWAYPGRIQQTSSNEVVGAMKSLSRKMLTGILPAISFSPGLLHWAHQLSVETGLNIDVPVDSTFEILYPMRRTKDWKLAEKRQATAVRKLAEEWASHDPKASIQALLLIEKGAQGIGASWPRWTPLFCTEIAQRVRDIMVWTRVGIDGGLPGDLVAPFLAESIRRNTPNWVETARQCLRLPNLRFIVIHLALITQDVPDDFLDDIFSDLEGAGGAIKTLCLRKEIMEDRVSRLLKNENPNIARAAATGEWMSSEGVRDSLREQCESVIATDFSGDFYLEKVFKTNPELARNWIMNLLVEGAKADDNCVPDIFRLEDTLRNAILALDYESRGAILKALTPSRLAGEIISHLIGNDDELYRLLTKNHNLKKYHLIPLYGGPNENWGRKIIIAVEAGYGDKDIVYATRYRELHGFSWTGKESEMWKEWKDRFAPYLTNSDSRIIGVARTATEYADIELKRALEEERHEAVYGR